MNSFLIDAEVLSRFFLFHPKILDSKTPASHLILLLFFSLIIFLNIFEKFATAFIP